MALCLHPELKLGELFVGWPPRHRAGHDASTCSSFSSRTPMGNSDELPLRRLRRIRTLMHAPGRERREPLQAQRRPPLRPRRAALRPLPRQRPAIFLRLFRPSGRQPRGGAAGQETAYRGQAAGRSGATACSISAPAGAAWGSISAQVAGAGYVSGASRSRRSSSRLSRKRAATAGLPGSGAVRARGLSRHDRHLRPHRVGRHVRACGPALLRRLFPGLPRAS